MTNRPSGEPTAISSPELQQLAWAAAPLTERLRRAPQQHALAPPADLQTAPLLLRWQQLLDQAAPAGFRTRLDQAGCNRTQAAAALASQGAIRESQWLQTFLQCLNADPTKAPPPPAEVPAALYPPLARFVSHGLDRIAEITTRTDILDPLRASLTDVLWRQLADLAMPVGAMLAVSRPQSPKALARQFAEIPVLARLLTEAVSRWDRSSRELLLRLASDLPLLATLDPRQPRELRPGSLQPGLSDPHAGGRQVARLGFVDGGACYYKPRSAQSDRAWGALLNWLQLQGDEPHLQHPTCLERGSYSWAEEISPEPCRTAAEVEHYYQRCGSLLCLLYLLRGGDVISDNLIAAGGYPFLVDTECLLSPPPLLAAPNANDQRGADVAMLQDSVAGTLMLPMPWQLDEGAPAEVSALTTAAGLTQAGATRAALRQLPHMPFLNEVPVPVDGYSNAVLDGFGRTYLTLLDWKARHPGRLPEPLQAFRDLQIRYIPRPTVIYQQLLARARTQPALADGTRRGLVFEYLARLHLQQPDPARLWPLFEAEVEALEAGDVPWFSVAASGRDLLLEGRVLIREAFPSAPWDRVMARWEQLSTRDLERQQQVITSLLPES